MKTEGLSDYIDGQIKQNTTFLSAQDFLQGSKPLRFRWIIVFLGALISFPAACLGAIPAFVLTLFISFFLLLRLNKQEYTWPQATDIQELADFLRQNLSQFPFSSWQVGNPTFFGIRDSSALVIQCVFENKTIHRILVDMEKSTYRVIAHQATTKHFLLRVGHLESSGLLYKNAYRIHPVLIAAIEYYIQSKQ